MSSLFYYLSLVVSPEDSSREAPRVGISWRGLAGSEPRARLGDNSYHGYDLPLTNHMRTAECRVRWNRKGEASSVRARRSPSRCGSLFLSLSASLYLSLAGAVHFHGCSYGTYDPHNKSRSSAFFAAPFFSRLTVLLSLALSLSRSLSSLLLFLSSGGVPAGNIVRSRRSNERGNERPEGEHSPRTAIIRIAGRVIPLEERMARGKRGKKSAGSGSHC